MGVLYPQLRSSLLCNCHMYCTICTGYTMALYLLVNAALRVICYVVFCDPTESCCVWLIGCTSGLHLRSFSKLPACVPV